MSNRLYRIEYRGVWSWSTTVAAPSREEAEATAEIAWENAEWPECDHDIEEVFSYLEGVE